MFCGGWRWIHKLIAIASISIGIGLMVGTLLSWGFFMIILSLALIILGVCLMFEN